MKKRICILLLAAFMLLLIPHVASANAPSGRRPDTLWVECKHLKSGAKIEAVLVKTDGSSRTEEASFSRYSNDTEGIAYIHVRDGETTFYLLITTKDDTKRTDAAEIIKYGGYTYDGRTNKLESTGAYYDPIKDEAQWILRIIYLAIPLGITLLIEWLVALCFGIRPVRYVFGINAITNPVMNIILLIVIMLNRGSFAYWIALAALELAVFGVEYGFYTRKYKSYSRPRLLLFTFVANAISFVAGIFLLSLL